MPRSKKADISTFSPRLLEVWRMALTKNVRIPVANQKEGTRLRFRLYELRSAMKDVGHEDYLSASRVSLSVVHNKDEGQYYVEAKHADSDLDEVLDKAGVPNPAEAAPPLPELYTVTEDERKPIKAYTKDEK